MQFYHSCGINAPGTVSRCSHGTGEAKSSDNEQLQIAVYKLAYYSLFAQESVCTCERRSLSEQFKRLRIEDIRAHTGRLVLIR
jgi:hypothetical protein